MRRHYQKRKQKMIGIVAGALCLLLLGRIYFIYRADTTYVSAKAYESPGSVFGAYISDRLQGQILKTYLPSLSYLLKSPPEDSLFTEYVLVDNVPLLKYIKTQAVYETEMEDMATYDRIMKQEANDEDDRAALWDALLNENASAALTAEQASDNVSGNETQRAELPVSMEELKNYDTLVKEFYAIDKSTSIDAEKLNAEKMLQKDMSLRAAAGEECGSILIYHTHSQEGYQDSIAGDLSTTVVGVGEVLAEQLRAYGYTVIHDTGVYDLQDRDYAYAKAGEALEQILAEHPEIEVVIDMHRDGVSEERRLVTEVEGRPMAQFMFFNGLSHTTTLGDIEYLPNAYIDDNLAFAFQLQLKAREYYPNLARKIYLKGYRYNLHYRPKSLLVEVGAQTNTLEEALASMEPLAKILDMVLTPQE